jgi:hypothetical protein
VGSLGTDVKRKFQGIVNRQGVDEMAEEAKKKKICAIKMKAQELFYKEPETKLYIFYTDLTSVFFLTSKTTNHPQCTQKELLVLDYGCGIVV